MYVKEFIMMKCTKCECFDVKITPLQYPRTGHENVSRSYFVVTLTKGFCRKKKIIYANALSATLFFCACSSFFLLLIFFLNYIEIWFDLILMHVDHEM